MYSSPSYVPFSLEWRSLARDLCRKSYLAVIAAFVAFGVCYAAVLCFPAYTCRAVLAVCARDGDPFECLSETSEMAKVYAELYTDASTLRQAAACLGTEYVWDDVTASAWSGVNLLTLSVTARSSALAEEGMNAILAVCRDPFDDASPQLVAPFQTEKREARIWERPTIMAAAAFVLSVGCTAVWSLMRDTIRSEAGLRQTLGLEPLGVIHHVTKRDRRGAPSTTEEYRRIAARLAHRHRVGQLGSLAVCSAVPREGKTTAAAAIAESLASFGFRVILMDMHLCAPSLYRFFEPQRGCAVEFSDFLKQKKELNAYPFRRMHGGRLLLALNTRTQPELSSWADMTHVRRCITAASEMADFVIVDTPSLLSSDASEWIRLCDGTLLVIRRDFARVASIRRALSVMEQCGAELVGCIWNDAYPNHRRADCGGGHIHAKRLSFGDFRAAFRRFGWICPVFSLLLGIACGAYTAAHPVFEAQSVIALRLLEEDGMDRFSYSSSAASRLENAFSRAVQSDMLANRICLAMGCEVLPASVCVSAVSGSNVMTISVRGQDEADTRQVLSQVMVLYPCVTEWILGQTACEIWEPPECRCVSDPLHTALEGALYGLLAAGILLTLYATVRRTIRDPEEAERELGAACLAAMLDGGDRTREAGILKNALRHGTVQQARMLFLASAESDDGAADIAHSLAQSYMRDGERVLLVDIAEAAEPGRWAAFSADPVQIAHNAFTGCDVLCFYGEREEFWRWLWDGGLCGLLDSPDGGYDRCLFHMSACDRFAGAEMAAQAADALLFVVRRDCLDISCLRSTVKRLTDVNDRLVGCVLYDPGGNVAETREKVGQKQAEEGEEYKESREEYSV